VAGLRLTLSKQEEEQLTHRSTDNQDACRAYVRGCYFWNKRTAGDLQRSIELFRATAALDPGYAHFGLALPSSALGQHPAAVAEARQACDLLSDSSVARSVLGYVAAVAGDQTTA